MSQRLKFDSLRYWRAVAKIMASAELAMIGFANAQPILIKQTNETQIKQEINNPNKSFDQLRQIDAGVLNVGYAEEGPANGTAVILLHGWPYDIHSFVDVAPYCRQRVIM